MEKGAAMLAKCIRDNKRLFLQVDSDCDGFTSAAVFLNYLNRLFPSFVQNNVIYRLHDGKQHGLIPDVIPSGTGLVVAPDSSSNDYEIHQFLNETCGMDVLVLDHHEADKVSEYACVINNQLCDYPTKSLSGVGVVYKFCSYLDTLMNVDYADDLLDLTALGIIADMMDMRDFETRHIITRGINNITNPFFKTMVEKNAFSLGDEITPIGIAFYVAPYVNAAVRMGTHEEKVLLFESMLEYKAYELIPSTKRGCKGQTETRVEQACRTCSNIKSRQTKARDSALETIEDLIGQNGLLDNKILSIKLEPHYAVDKNLTGLIANQLMSKYQRPVLLLNQVVQEDGTITWAGSARGYDKSKLKDFRQFFNDTHLVELGQGHANAFGAAIRDDMFDRFVQQTNHQLANFNFTPCYNVDFIFNGDNFKGSDIIEIADLKCLWGQGIDEPYIALENVRITPDNITLMSADKNPTLKIQLPNGTSLIKFKSSIEEYESLKPETGCYTLTVIGRCESNSWNGRISPQIIIEEYEKVGEMKYYF
jgi:single-stranded-DNA-specific exonuclease